MVRWIRHKLWLINYRGAHKPRTLKTRATDWAMTAALVLALPAAFFGNALIQRPAVVEQISGVFYSFEGGGLRASSSTDDRPFSSDYKGSYVLTRSTTMRGWPLRTQADPLPINVDLDILSEPNPRKHVGLAADDPIRTALEDRLERTSNLEMLEALRTGDPAAENYWRGWTANSVIFWVMLTILFGLLVTVGALVAEVWQGKRKLRHRSRRIVGLCPHCTYDMRGLEFSERCPECGALAE